MGSSDLDALTLVSDATDGNQLSCSLPLGGCTTHRGGGVPRRFYSIPVQGEPQGSRIGISALDPVASMGRKQ